jgi:hypothetical protein
MLGSIVITVNARPVTFLDEFGFSVQPMLHIVALSRAGVHISEICLARHRVRAGCEINSVLVKVRHGRRRQDDVGSGRGHGLVMFHGLDSKPWKSGRYGVLPYLLL